MRNNRDVSAKQQENIYNIVDFGAKGNGDFLNTKCIQKGIDTVHEAGGGKLIIPKGIFLCGSLVLKSKVELHLTKGAILLGSTDPSDYQQLSRFPALLLAEAESHISLTGEGKIDGQGRELALNINELYYQGKIAEKN